MRSRDPQKIKAIREKALAMIVKEGFTGLSMHKLAKAAGVSPATIYIYYKDREDLILSLFAEVSERMIRQTLEGFNPKASFKKGLRVQWMNRADFCLKHPDEAHFMEQIRYSPLHKRAAERMDGKFHKAMETFFHGAVQRGELKKMPPEIYWSVAFAPLYQLLKFHKHHIGMNPGKKFVLDKKTMSLALDLVTGALAPK